MDQIQYLVQLYQQVEVVVEEANQVIIQDQQVVLVAELQEKQETQELLEILLP